MSVIIDAIIQEVEAFNESIRDALNSKNITNTGEAAKSLEVQYGENFVRSVGIFYLEFLDTGRGSGKFPPLAPIMKWARQKLGITDENELKSVAFLVARKIAKLGTEIFRDNKKGIELEKKIIALRESIAERITTEATIEITKRLDNFKKLYEFNLS